MNKTVFIYQFEDVRGVVLADNETAAQLEVLAAYQKHGYSDLCAADVTVKDAFACNCRFIDNPNVIECWNLEDK